MLHEYFEFSQNDVRTLADDHSSSGLIAKRYTLPPVSLEDMLFDLLLALIHQLSSFSESHLRVCLDDTLLSRDLVLECHFGR